MSYTPLDSGILTSSVLANGPDVVAVWTLILASADKLGETEITPTAAHRCYASATNGPRKRSACSNHRTRALKIQSMKAGGLFRRVVAAGR